MLVGAGVCLAGLLAVVLYQTTTEHPPSAAGSPADAFMQSVVARDGQLGWQQLCPSTQAELPLAQLIQETDALRSSDALSGITVSMQFVGAQPRPEGGERRFYRASASRAGAEQVQKTFVVRTQASGCVEALE
jgi:hypothetical protein